MRCRWLSVPALLLAGVVAVGQQPGQPPPQVQVDPVKNKLDAILVNWEKAMSSLSTLYTQVKRSATDKVFLTSEVFEGEARYIKPNRARLWLVNTDPKKQGQFEKIVVNGQNTYIWQWKEKEILAIQMPAPKAGQVDDTNVVALLFGMKATEAKRRYDLTLLAPPPGDTFYHYIQVLPREQADKSEFTRARLVLTIATHLPAQIWFEGVNGNETTWDFRKVTPNVQLDAKDFDRPNEPGWKIQTVDPNQKATFRSQQ